MIAWTVLALLRLDGSIVHLHIIFDRCHVLMSKKLLQAERIIPKRQIASGKGVPEDVWTDAFARHPCPFLETRKQERHAILGEGLPGF